VKFSREKNFTYYTVAFAEAPAAAAKSFTVKHNRSVKITTAVGGGFQLRTRVCD